MGIAVPDLGSNAEFLTTTESMVIDAINAHREALGIAPLIYDANLHTAARIRSGELYANAYNAHTRPNGDAWYTVLRVDVPINPKTSAENLASLETQANHSKISDEAYWFNQWKNSPSHYAAMIDPRYTHVGVGIVDAYDGEKYYGYATTLFGAW